MVWVTAPELSYITHQWLQLSFIRSPIHHYHTSFLIYFSMMIYWMLSRIWLLLVSHESWLYPASLDDQISESTWAWSSSHLHRLFFTCCWPFLSRMFIYSFSIAIFLLSGSSFMVYPNDNPLVSSDYHLDWWIAVFNRKYLSWVYQ